MKRFGPPQLPGSNQSVESPADRSLSLAFAEEREAALRWAAAIVKADPSMPTALCLCGRLLGELGRQEMAQQACAVAAERAVDLENLPLAVACARELERFGGDPGPLLDSIAGAFCKGSARHGEGASPPEPLPAADDFHPLPSVLTGAALINKATEIVREAKKLQAALEDRPGISALPLFSTIGKEALRDLCEALSPQWIAADHVVIQQGEVGSEAYFVARGELEARRERKGELMALARLQNGAIFGEMALLARAPRTGSVVATRPSIVLEVSKEALDRVAERHPEVGKELAIHCRDRMVQNLTKMSGVLKIVPDADRPALVERFRPVTFEKNDRLILQDEAPPGLFLIASGEVAVVRREGEDGDPLVISTLGVGDVVGEVAMVLRRKANCEVVALHPTVTLFLPAQDFLGLIHDHPSILAELYLLAVQRDEETTSILAEEVSIAEDFDLI
jgi:CRP-like cAMP-binding protein